MTVLFFPFSWVRPISVKQKLGGRSLVWDSYTNTVPDCLLRAGAGLLPGFFIRSHPSLWLQIWQLC